MNEVFEVTYFEPTYGGRTYRVTGREALRKEVYWLDVGGFAYRIREIKKGKV